MTTAVFGPTTSPRHENGNSQVQSLLVAFGYLVGKLIFWDWFTVGIALIINRLFFFSSVQPSFIGIIGELSVRFIPRSRSGR
jgi:hypothetical protein